MAGLKKRIGTVSKRGPEQGLTKYPNIFVKLTNNHRRDMNGYLKAILAEMQVKNVSAEERREFIRGWQKVESECTGSVTDALLAYIDFYIRTGRKK